MLPLLWIAFCSIASERALSIKSAYTETPVSSALALIMPDHRQFPVFDLQVFRGQNIGVAWRARSVSLEPLVSGSGQHLMG